jgi:hypothetical protein
MNRLTMNKSSRNHDLDCAGVAAMAEHELTALFTAVKELFGTEVAELSAEEWLRELAATEGLPSSAHEWRGITLNIGRRLAARVNGLSIASPTLTLA